MTWDQLRAVSRGGITVASHGHSHRSLARLDPATAERDVLSARALLLEQLNVDNPFFAFPFGTRKDFSQPLADMLSSHGYRFCFTSIHGSCEPKMNTNPFPRLKIESGESLNAFVAIVKGYLDVWHLVDNRVWWLQQNGRF
jgi:peptidoglycan/xylan/chitin deacetylase (PgdA/CDA1 family)